MSFYRKNWYYVGGILFVVLAFFVGFWGNQIDPLRKILLLSFMSLLMHQFEEYALPGGFPAVFNIGWNHETEAPDRYPLNRLSCVCVNTFLAYPFYILPIVFPRVIWLGLAQIMFGMVGQLFIHGIVINRKLHSYYNPGLAVTVCLLVPIGVLLHLVCVFPWSPPAVALDRRDCGFRSECISNRRIACQALARQKLALSV